MQILLNFNLPSDIVAENIFVAYLKIYYLSKNNNPFDVLGSFLNGEHLTYDYTPIDGNDYKPPIMITPTIIVADSSTPTNDWIEINVTDFIKNDLSIGKAQFRFYFAIPTNNDNQWNYCSFYSADNTTNKPYLEIYYY